MLVNVISVLLLVQTKGCHTQAWSHVVCIYLSGLQSPQNRVIE